MNRRDFDSSRSEGDPIPVRTVLSRDEPRDESSARVSVRDDEERDADVDVRPDARPDASERPSLLPHRSLSGYQSRWERVQIGFVDEPRTAVRDAEALVSEMVKELTDVFTRERESLERAWSSGSDASTEDMRVALQRYRSFFARLLAA